MTNYAAIADAAQSFPSAQLAFDAMSAEVVVSQPTELMLTDKRIAARLGIAATSELVAGLQAAVVAGEIPPFVVTWLQDGTGIDLIDSSTFPMLDGLQMAGRLSPTLVTSLKGLADITTPVWPGLELGHVVNALQMREAYTAALAEVAATQAQVDAQSPVVTAAETTLSAAQSALNTTAEYLAVVAAEENLAVEQATLSANSVAASQAQTALSKLTEV